jgi:hypothetical protein
VGVLQLCTLECHSCTCPKGMGLCKIDGKMQQRPPPPPPPPTVRCCSTWRRWSCRRRGSPLPRCATSGERGYLIVRELFGAAEVDRLRAAAGVVLAANCGGAPRQRQARQSLASRSSSIRTCCGRCSPTTGSTGWAASCSVRIRRGTHRRATCTSAVRR